MASQTTRAQIVLITVCAAALHASTPLVTPHHDPATPIQIVKEFDHEGRRISARSIAPDPLGFLWVASDSGLYRFDGTHFHLVNNRPATSVQETSDGWVWVGGPQGLERFRDGARVTVLHESVTALRAAGKYITVAADHVWRGDVNGMRSFNVKSNGGMFADRESNIWFGCGDQVCELTASGLLDRYLPPASTQVAPGDNRFWLGAARDDEGNIWCWNDQFTIRSKPETESVFYYWPFSTGPLDTRTAIRMMDGAIWIDGYARISHGELFTFDHPSDGGRQDYPRFQADKYGNLWEASPGGGLAVLSPRSWVKSWGKTAFPTGCNSITRSGPRLLVSCGNGVFEFTGYGDANEHNHNSWKLVAGTEFGSPAWSSAGQAGRGVWSILAGRGIVRIGPNGEEQGAAWRGANLRGFEFRSLFRDVAGRLWVGAKQGFFRVDAENSRLIRQTMPGNPDYATALATGPDGRVYLGTEAGIERLRPDGRWELVVPKEALFSPQIRSLGVGAGPVFWVVYQFNVPFSRIEAGPHGWTRKDFSVEDGYWPSENRSVLVDGNGWIWRSTAHGVFVSDGIHLAPDDWIQLNTWNNLPDEATGYSAFFPDRDGTMWIATNGGIAHVTPDPAWFAAENLPAPRVTALRWHGRELLLPRAGNTLEDPGGDLEVDFAQWPSVGLKPTSLRYRLIPAETSWRSGGSGTARYANLRAGLYRFELRSRNSPIATYSFEVTGKNPAALRWVLSTSLLATLALLGWNLRMPILKKIYWSEKQAFIAVSTDYLKPVEFGGTTIAGRYWIERQIGEGGFATVWKAIDRETQQPVAVKCFKMEDEIEHWQILRFEQETAALGKLDHPGIVKLIDSGQDDDGNIWLAMNWIDGPNLRAVLKSGPVARERIILWLRQIGEAIAEAHASNVLHRDLKPENILIEHMGLDREQAVVVDFGAATLTHEPDGQTSMHLGSFDYMPPERVLGRSFPSGDVYGLAAIAFELLTGVKYAGVAAASANEMKRLLAALPDAAAELLALGLAYSPEERMSNIRQFAFDLSEALKGI